MKILLDENLPHDLRHFLPGHDVFTVTYQQWTGLRNGELMARAAAEGFQALLTMDLGLAHQQNPSELPLSVITIRAASNTLDDLRPLAPAILRALDGLPPQSLVQVP